MGFLYRRRVQQVIEASVMIAIVRAIENKLMRKAMLNARSKRLSSFESSNVGRTIAAGGVTHEPLKHVFLLSAFWKNVFHLSQTDLACRPHLHRHIELHCLLCSAKYH